MEDDNKKKLIKETITGKKLNAERLLRYVVISAACGLAFGITGTYAFRLISRAFDGNISDQTESTFAIETGKTSGKAETDAAVSDSESSAEMSSEDIPESTEDIIPGPDESESPAAGDSAGSGDKESEGGEDAEAAAEESEQAALTEKALSAVSSAVEISDKYLVSISATSTATTWFDSETENTEEYSGAIIGIDEHEVLILSTFTDTDDKELKVTFNNGSSSDAYLKQKSPTDGLSVIAVSATEGMSDETLESIAPAEYCDASGLRCGQLIAAVGSPFGINHSCDSGVIGYIDPAEQAEDCSRQVIYSVITDNAGKGTFAINIEGKLIGVFSDISSKSSVAPDAGASGIISMSSLDKMLKTMMSGEKLPYLGIMGIDVDDSMKNSNIPQGVYVTDVHQDSPAYNAGIRRGDVITELADRKVSDMKSFEKVMGTLKPEDSCAVRVMRGSVNSEYKEIDYEITLGER